jgi:hypothetical protein
MEKALRLAEESDITVNSRDLALIAEVWGLDEQSKKGVSRASHMTRIKHGMLAQVPMVCRGDACPYVSTCYIAPEERPKQGRCPIEIATILALFERYCYHLDVTEEDIVDLTLIKELIDLDVQLLRADHYMAARPEFVEEVPVFVTEDGIAFTKPEISKVVEYKERLRKERHRILQLLNSTRKDKEGGKTKRDPSSLAAEILARAREMGIYQVIDIQPQGDGDRDAVG